MFDFIVEESLLWESFVILELVNKLSDFLEGENGPRPRIDNCNWFSETGSIPALSVSLGSDSELDVSSGSISASGGRLSE
jgi:hypothetical protein